MTNIQKAYNAEEPHNHFHNPASTIPHHDDVDSKLSSDVPPVTASFPDKLMYILDNEDIYGNTASWLPDGRSFVIRNPHRFAEEVLPHFFRRGCKFNSFMRKLYYWGFKKTKSKGQGAEVKFHHKNFRRGSAPSCMHLRTLQKSFQKKYLKSNVANKIDYSDSDSDGDISSSSDEAESSMLGTDDSNILRMVKEAIDVHDQKNNMNVSKLPLAEQSHVEQLPTRKRVQYERPLYIAPLTSLQQANNLLSVPMRGRTLPLHPKVLHPLGNGFQRRNVQSPIINTIPLKPLYHANGIRSTMNTYPLNTPMLRGAITASMLPGTNMMSIAPQQNIADLSSFLNNISTLRPY